MSVRACVRECCVDRGSVSVDKASLKWRVLREASTGCSECWALRIIRLVDVSSSGHVLCELDGWRLSERFGWSSETRCAHKGAWLSEGDVLLKYWGGNTGLFCVDWLKITFPLSYFCLPSFEAHLRLRIFCRPAFKANTFWDIPTMQYITFMASYKVSVKILHWQLLWKMEIILYSFLYKSIIINVVILKLNY